jgi:hypothetical protein
MRALSLVIIVLILMPYIGWGNTPAATGAPAPTVPPAVSAPQVIGGAPADILRVGGYAYVNVGTGRCNGVLIDPEWVLTAAFCVYPNGVKIAPSQVSVELGCYAKPTGNVCASTGGSGLLYGTTAQRISAKTIYEHAQLSVVSGVPQPPYGVALIRLASPARTGAGVTPLPLAGADDNPSAEASPYVASFGDVGLLAATATRTASRTATMSRTATVPTRGTATNTQTRTPNLTRSATMTRSATVTQTATKTNVPVGIGTTVLRTASVRLLSDDACTLPGFSGATLWCADATAQGNDLCYGDTGAPLLSTVAGQTMVFGVSLPKTQFGATYNCMPGTQSAFVDVRAPAIREWVTNTIQTVSQRAVNTLLGGSAGFGEVMLDRSDNDMSQIDIRSVFPQGIRIGNTTSTTLSVNANGVVALGDVRSIPAVINLQSWRGAPLFAPFVADGDTSGSGFRPLVGSRGSGANRVWVAQSVTSRTVTITWDDVRPYVVMRPQYVGNTYQLQLRSEENGDVRVTLRYGVIQWTYGEKDCGMPCLASRARHAQIGVVSGDGKDVQLLRAVSGVESALRALNSTHTLFVRDGKVWRFNELPPERATYTASVTSTATATTTVTGSATATVTASQTASHTATPTVTNTATVTNTPTAVTHTVTVSNTPTLTATHTPTPTSTSTPAITNTPTVTQTSTPLAQGLTDGLLAWYPLNGIRTTGSTLPVQANTIMGAAQSFDGVNDYHQTSVNLANTSFTISYWASDGRTTDSNGMALSAGSVWEENKILLVGIHNWPDGLYMRCASLYASETRYKIPSTFDLTEWHHYTCMYDMVSRTMKIYIDGVQVALNTDVSAIATNTNFYVGAFLTGCCGLKYFKGTLRDVMVYNRALSEVELNRIKDITPNSVMLSEPHPASACRWVDKGGMVHEYEINQDLLTWDQAKVAAEARTRGGQQGYLATIMSAAENECLVQFVDTQSGWESGTAGHGPWIGAKRVSPGGVFVWQGGPEQGIQLKSSNNMSSVGYENWYDGYPNNLGGVENYMHMFGRIRNSLE